MKIDALTGNKISSFGNNGVMELLPASVPSNLYFTIGDVEIDKQGKILIAGKQQLLNSSPADVYGMIVRINPNGTWDNTFGTNGIGTYYDDPAKVYKMEKISVTQANDYLLTGSYYTGTDYDYAVCKIKNNGTLNNSYGINGWQIHDLFGNQKNEGAYNAQLMPDEKLLLTGNHGSGDTVYFSMLMLHPNGSRDYSFGADGIFTNIFNQNNNSSSRGLAIDPAGKIILGGYTRTCTGGNCGPMRMAVSRYTFDIGNPLSILDQSKDQNIIIYPNPTIANAPVYISGIDKIESVNLFALDGRKIEITADNANKRVNIGTLAAGTYFLKIKTEGAILNKNILVQ
jgi:uncharacterized delta-60 repeat protein